MHLISVITIEPIKFEDQRIKNVTFGYRLYNDYGTIYDNIWESIFDDNLEVLSKVMDSDDTQVL